MSVPRKELNILLLGQTGCGKSTFINALFNYFQYDTLEDALRNLDNLHIVIPTRYSWPLPDYEQADVVLGDHDNECRDAIGVSGTQWPREFLYNYGDYIVRLIDTPGFADTSGTDKDKINGERILKFVHRYSHLHAVCILFKPNETRNTSLFKYCFETLFTQMHKNIFKNIICVFTFTKGTDYQPGETLALLRNSLHQVQESQREDKVDMKLGADNIICFENDCFNFLGAVKKGVTTTLKKDVYLKSWEISSDAAINLVEKVKKLQPYSVNELISLQGVRQDSMKLIEIYKELRKELVDQKAKLEQTSSGLEDAEARIQELIRRTNRITKHTMEGKFILCFNKKCGKRDDLGNYYMCRNDSDGWGSFLKMDMLGNNCKYCGCDMRYHSDVTKFEIKRREVDRQCEDLKTKEIIKRNRAKLTLLECRIDICNLSKENQILSIVLHRISTYISKHSIISPKDMSHQIKLDIESEKGKEKPNVTKIQRLKDDLDTQQLLIKFHDEFKEKSDEGSSTEEIKDILSSLQELPYVGPKIQKLYEADVDNSPYYEPVIVNAIG